MARFFRRFAEGVFDEADVIARAVPLRAVVPLTQPALPDLGGRRALVVSGIADPIAPPEAGEGLAALLRAAGAAAEARALAAGRGLVQADLDAARACLG